MRPDLTKVMTMLRRLFCAGNSVLLATLVTLHANAATEFSPAGFGDPGTENSLYGVLLFPDIKGDVEVKLFCTSQIKADGKMKGTGCYVENQFDQPFADAIVKAAKKARLKPATFDGSPQSVYLQFRALFVAKGDERTVALLNNPGEEENVAEYGENHIAAQRRLEKNAWEKACPKRAKYFVYLRAHVAADGHASNVSIAHGSGIMPTETCRKAIIDAVAASDFTPAYLDGVPVPSTFVEPFGN